MPPVRINIFVITGMNVRLQQGKTTFVLMRLARI